MIWLGSKRGALSDWLTQRWVQSTGKRVNIADEPWLEGPIAPATGIGSDFFASLAEAEGLLLHRNDPTAGVMADFLALRGPTFEPSNVHSSIARFYEQTAAYHLDAWAHWTGLFRPFGWLLAVIFSRRLQQLNIPLSGLDTSKGMTNEILKFNDPATRLLRYTAWYRHLRVTGNVLYAGFYSVCQLPGHTDPCVKVVFPLPNGNAMVIMRAESQSDGSFILASTGSGFGMPGFYFTVQDVSGKMWARYVKALRESIHVHPEENGCLTADHVLTYFGATFLRIHYRMQPITGIARAADITGCSTAW
jgi:hypothetical protein